MNYAMQCNWLYHRQMAVLPIIVFLKRFSFEPSQFLNIDTISNIKCLLYLCWFLHLFVFEKVEIGPFKAY